MLVLTRNVGESIEIDGQATITVLKRTGNKLKIGIEAPKTTRVERSELKDKQKAEASA